MSFGVPVWCTTIFLTDELKIGPVVAQRLVRAPLRAGDDRRRRPVADAGPRRARRHRESTRRRARRARHGAASSRREMRRGGRGTRRAPAAELQRGRAASRRCECSRSDVAASERAGNEPAQPYRGVAGNSCRTPARRAGGCATQRAGARPRPTRCRDRRHAAARRAQRDRRTRSARSSPRCSALEAAPAARSVHAELPRARRMRADVPADTRFVPLPGARPAALVGALRRPAHRPLARARPHVVHATNYLAPPSRLPTLVSVYDCSFVRYPGAVHARGARARADRPPGDRPRRDGPHRARSSSPTRSRRSSGPGCAAPGGSS